MTLYVGNLSRMTRTRDLEDYFDRFGECEIAYKKDSRGDHESFAFIKYKHKDDAEDAKYKMNRKMFLSKKMVVQWANKNMRDPYEMEGI